MVTDPFKNIQNLMLMNDDNLNSISSNIDRCLKKLTSANGNEIVPMGHDNQSGTNG
jgi:hypothetical protein